MTLTARYDTESFTFYTTKIDNNHNNSNNKDHHPHQQQLHNNEVVNTVTTTTSTPKNDEEQCHNNVSVVDTKDRDTGSSSTRQRSTGSNTTGSSSGGGTFVPVVTVDIQYATTTIGGSIIPSVSSTSTAAAAATASHDNGNVNDDDDDDDGNTTGSIQRSGNTTGSSNSNNNNNNNNDQTGIFIWPATYLLCQYLIFDYETIMIHQQQPLSHDVTTECSRNSITTTNILELGCGCGMVSSVFMKYHRLQQQQQQQHQSPTPPNHTHVVRWYATDMDTTALQMCYHNNSILNGIPSYYVVDDNHVNHNDHNSAVNHDSVIDDDDSIEMNTLFVTTPGNADITSSSSQSTTTVQKLCWGNINHINTLINALKKQQQQQKEDKLFDIIVAADIIYPSQNKQILRHLFDTVDMLLRKNDECDDCNTGSRRGGGIMYLSYCHRDPTYQTILQFIQAASDANFIISSPDNPSHPIYDIATLRQQQYLPPLLDAQILILQRATTTVTASTTPPPPATPVMSSPNGTNTAQLHNDQLGHEKCTIFPNLRTKVQLIVERNQRRQRRELRRTNNNNSNNNNSNDDKNNCCIDDVDDDDTDDSDTIWDAPPLLDSDCDETV